MWFLHTREKKVQRTELMNVSLPYKEIFHENEVEVHSSINHIDNRGDSVSLNETIYVVFFFSRKSLFYLLCLQLSTIMFLLLNEG
jgi:hypothetical protein